MRSTSVSMGTEQVSYGHAQMGQIPDSMALNGWQQMHMSQLHTPTSNLNGNVISTLQSQVNASGNFPYPDSSMQMMHTTSHTAAGVTYSTHMESPVNNFMNGSPTSSPPAWLSLPSPSIESFGSQGLSKPHPNMRYPVLQCLIPKLANIIPTAVACDLLELYFTSSTSTYLRPISPYLLAFVFRKHSFLHPTNPRKCSPALLASMLLLAAQTSDASFLTSPPSARSRICQKLLELTVSLLQPLIHGGDGSLPFTNSYEVNCIALDGLSMPTNADPLASTTGGMGSLDDVATYIHLATVVSASEHKAASMRWWTVAFTLARELKLGRELSANPSRANEASEEDADADGDFDIEMHHNGGNGLGFASFGSATTTSSYSEEEREERRRIWWLLYTVDRHLALCYNRPLFLLDVECVDLYQPVCDTIWQAGEHFTGYEATIFPELRPVRPRGPTFACTSHSIFGFFTPLMTILGEIVELQQARNHPRFGPAFSATEVDQRIAGITCHLDTYEQTLKEFEARNNTGGELSASAGATMHMGQSPQTPSARTTESVFQTKTVVAYGTHVLHVLHILLAGKWDPITLLDDSDLWISSQSFIYASQYSVSGAEAVAQILDYDPDLSFMPFFFGIYLLQGSFLLLLIADKLASEASSSVVAACEVVVRAIEGCVATLSTEYQVCIRRGYFVDALLKGWLMMYRSVTFARSCAPH